MPGFQGGSQVPPVAHVSNVILKVDFRNAFNTVDRGALLFALALQPALQAARAGPAPPSLALAFLDDVCLAGDYRHVAASLTRLAAAARQVRLELNEANVNLSPVGGLTPGFLCWSPGQPFRHLLFPWSAHWPACLLRSFLPERAGCEGPTFVGAACLAPGHPNCLLTAPALRFLLPVTPPGLHSNALATSTALFGHALSACALALSLPRPGCSARLLLRREGWVYAWRRSTRRLPTLPRSLAPLHPALHLTPPTTSQTTQPTSPLLPPTTRTLCLPTICRSPCRPTRQRELSEPSRLCLPA